MGPGPKAFFLFSRALYVIGAGNKMTAIPFSQTARNIQSLMNFQLSVTESQTQKDILSDMPSACTSTSSTGVYPTFANNNVFFLCSVSRSILKKKNVPPPDSHLELTVLHTAMIIVQQRDNIFRACEFQWYSFWYADNLASISAICWKYNLVRCRGFTIRCSGRERNGSLLCQ